MKAEIRLGAIICMSIFAIISTMFVLQNVLAPITTETSDFSVKFTTDATHLDHIDIYMTIQNLQAMPIIANLNAILNQTTFKNLKNLNFEIYVWKTYADTCMVDDASRPFFCNVLQNRKECYSDYKVVCEYKQEICGYEQKEVICQKEGWVKYNTLSKDIKTEKGEIKPVFSSVPIGAKGQALDTLKIKIRIDYPIEKRIDTDTYGSKGYFYLNINDKTYYDFSHSSWWDSNWLYRKNFTILSDNADIFYKQPVYAWFNGTDGHVTNCNEIRITNTTGQEIPRSIAENITSGSNYNCQFVFQVSQKIVNRTSQQYTIYYGNNGVGETTYTTDLSEVSDATFYYVANTQLNASLRKLGGLPKDLLYKTGSHSTGSWVTDLANWIITAGLSKIVFDCSGNVAGMPNITYNNIYNKYYFRSDADGSQLNITIFNEIPLLQGTYWFANQVIHDANIQV